MGTEHPIRPSQLLVDQITDGVCHLAHTLGVGISHREAVVCDQLLTVDIDQLHL